MFCVINVFQTLQHVLIRVSSPHLGLLRQVFFLLFRFPSTTFCLALFSAPLTSPEVWACYLSYPSERILRVKREGGWEKVHGVRKDSFDSEVNGVMRCAGLSPGNANKLSWANHLQNLEILAKSQLSILALWMCFFILISTLTENLTPVGGEAYGLRC